MATPLESFSYLKDGYTIREALVTLMTATPLESFSYINDGYTIRYNIISNDLSIQLQRLLQNITLYTQKINEMCRLVACYHYGCMVIQ